MRFKNGLSFSLTACMATFGLSLSTGSLAGWIDGYQQSDPTTYSAQQAEGTTTDQVIVKYKAGAAATASANTMADRAQQFADSIGVSFSHVRTTSHGAQVMKLGVEMTPAEMQQIIDKIEQSGDVEYAEPDLIMHPFYTPNDPRYNEQWGYHDQTGGIRAPAAWDTTQGEGVVVAVVDTGYRPHPDLKDNILPGYDMVNNSTNSGDGDGRDSDATDMGDGSTGCKPYRSTWHGTHVAGTVAALTNNSIGVSGTAFKAKVVPVRVLAKCGGYTSDIADGIIWAAGGNVSNVPANQNPAKVINLSLGGESSTCPQTYQQAIDTARQKGASLIVAAGNETKDVSGFTPANCTGIIAVANSNRQGGRTSSSNYGSMIDLAAPGDSILSTHNSGQITPGSDTYGTMTGTSMSAPHVAGVAALMYAVKSDITPDQVEQFLKESARAFPASCQGCGSGILDAAAAVSKASGGTAPVDPPVDPPSDNALTNKVAKTNLSGNAGATLKYVFDVPAGATNLSFKMSGGTGDADLYVKFNAEPTDNSYDCRPYLQGNNETCTISNIQTGRYHVMIKGYSTFSGVSLEASYDLSNTTPVDPPVDPPSDNALTNKVAKTNLSGNAGATLKYIFDVPADATNLSFRMSGGTGDADLYVKFNAEPTDNSYDCRPYLEGNNETCTISNIQTGRYHVMVKGYSTFSGVSLVASYDLSGATAPADPWQPWNPSFF
ncbi:MAG: S8 family serine peptidase [Candidatus Thiodiazotropha sp. (ex Lucinoma borealis)]|nr:S8 family serine peptidase [Candidatus Thiodiazotropha sp. (ex Lucinoma borealis)]